MLKSKNETHLLALSRVAQEIGVSAATVVRHPDDFFPVIRLGGKNWVASRTYSSWLQKRLSEASREPSRT